MSARWRGSAAAGIVAVAVAVAGCGGSSSGGDAGAAKAESGFSGEEARLAEVVDRFNKAGRSKDAGTMCALLSKAMVREIEQSGKRCPKILSLAMKGVDTKGISIRATGVRIDGRQAEVEVYQSGGGKREYVMPAVNEGGEWKLDEVGPPGSPERDPEFRR